MFAPETVAAPRTPRRFVEKKGNRTKVTRKSATARIAGLPQAASARVPLDPVLVVPPSAAAAAARPPPPAWDAADDDSRSLRRRGRPATWDTERAASELDLSGDESDASYDSFTLSLKKKDLFALDAGPPAYDDDDDDDQDSARSTAAPPLPGASPRTAHSVSAAEFQVLRSRYDEGEGAAGCVGAQLVVAPRLRPGQGDAARALFHWSHVENAEMSFAAFFDFVLKSPHLGPQARDSVVSILRTARDKSDRSLRMPLGIEGNYVEPEYFDETVQSTDYRGPRSQHDHEHRVRWLSIPYFFLGPSSRPHTTPKDPVVDADAYPDLDPDLYRTGFIAHGEFFQVAQFWCLIVDDCKSPACTSCR